MQSHELDYKIIGHDIQMVEIELDPRETVVAEAGAMVYMREGIEFETKMGDGSNPDQGFMSKLISMGSRALTGESLFMTHFTNRGFGKSQVAFSAPYPGTIVPIDLQKVGGQLIVQKAGFLCAALGTKVALHFNKKIGSGLFGGEGFILQKLQGDGLAFVHAGGTLVEHDLRNETLRVDTGCVVAFEAGIDFSVETSGGLKSMLFGGEGIFLSTLRGTGKVWLQSMPFSKLVQAMSPGSPESRRGKGSILGSFID